MASYVKGNAVDNATSYELAEKTSSGYTKLAEDTEINFDLSTLSLTTGDHTLVVKAKASGYTDSDWSNEVTYTNGGGTTTVNAIEPTTYTLAAGYRFDTKIALTSSEDATLTVLVTAENETYTGYLVMVYINADTSRAVKGKIGTPFTVDVLSTDTKLWFYTNGIQGLETSETFTITATMEVGS